MMKRLFKIAVFVILAFLVSGCRYWKLASIEHERKSDSVIIRTEYIERFDTAYITITKEIQQVLEDTASVLENDYCISEARITPDGYLFHSLETKPQQKPVPVKTTEKVRDTTIYKEKEVYIKDPVPVEREFTRWELVRLHGFWYMLAALVLALIWICRKPLIKILLRIIKV